MPPDITERVDDVALQRVRGKVTEPYSGIVAFESIGSHGPAPRKVLREPGLNLEFSHCDFVRSVRSLQVDKIIAAAKAAKTGEEEEEE